MCFSAEISIVLKAVYHDVSIEPLKFLFVSVQFIFYDSMVFTHLLEVPSVRLKSYGDRAFSVAAPKHWNDIPLDIKLSGSVDVFKSRLKTYLFRLAFS